MTSMLDIIEDYCVYRKFKFSRIDGNTSLEDREKQMCSFTREGSDIFLFLLSTRAGGLGINLNSADTVIIYDSDFNPQVDLQAMDRAHRIGQKRDVYIYRLITEGTIEEKIVERQLIKLRWDQIVIQSGRLTQMGHQSKQTANPKQDEIKNIVEFNVKNLFKYEKVGTFNSEGTPA